MAEDERERDRGTRWGRGKMRKHVFIFLLFIPLFAHADEMSMDTARQMQISSLKREISELEIKLQECSRKNKNWRTATWIGGAGQVLLRWRSTRRGRW